MELLEAFRADAATVQAIAVGKFLTTLSHAEARLTEPTAECTWIDRASYDVDGCYAGILAARYQNEPTRVTMEALAMCYGAAVGVCKAAVGGASWRGAVGLLDQMRGDGLSHQMIGALPRCSKGLSCSIYGSVLSTCASAGRWREVMHALARLPTL